LSTSDDVTPAKALPAWRKAVNFLCGIDNDPKPAPDMEVPKLSKEEEARLAAESLEEDPSWKR
jgi:hypothetical protein